MFLDNTTMMPIHSDDKEILRKCIEIWDKINELIGINNLTDFVGITSDDEDEFIMLEVELIQALLEINIETILHLFLHLFLIIYFKHH